MMLIINKNKRNKMNLTIILLKKIINEITVINYRKFEEKIY